MDPLLTKYLQKIGRKGGRKSRRSLSSDSARQMVKVREARRAYRDASCFWSFDPDYVVTSKDIPWVVQHLQAHGAQAGWEKAAQLCR